VSQHHDPVHPEGAHLDAEVIADLQIGALDDESAAHARDHLAQCAQCRAVADALVEVSATLAALPAVTVPEDIAERWTAALAAEPVLAASGGATVVPMGAKTPARSGSWSGRGLAIAASAAGLLLVAALAYPMLTHDNSGSHTVAPLAGNASQDTAEGNSTEAIPAAVVSGTEYQTSSLEHQVTAQLATYASPAAASTDGAGATDFTASPSTTPTPTPTPSVSTSVTPPVKNAPLMVADRNAELACLSAFLNPGSVPLLVDVAAFQGQPAVVVVVPASDDPTKIEVWVMARHCTPTNYQVLYFLRIDRP
jgi:hypothetical protein